MTKPLECALRVLCYCEGIHSHIYDIISKLNQEDLPNFINLFLINDIFVQIKSNTNPLDLYFLEEYLNYSPSTTDFISSFFEILKKICKTLEAFNIELTDKPHLYYNKNQFCTLYKLPNNNYIFDTSKGEKFGNSIDDILSKADYSNYESTIDFFSSNNTCSLIYSPEKRRETATARSFSPRTQSIPQQRGEASAATQSISSNTSNITKQRVTCTFYTYFKSNLVMKSKCLCSKDEIIIHANKYGGPNFQCEYFQNSKSIDEKYIDMNIPLFIVICNDFNDLCLHLDEITNSIFESESSTYISDKFASTQEISVARPKQSQSVPIPHEPLVLPQFIFIKKDFEKLIMIQQNCNFNSVSDVLRFARQKLFFTSNPQALTLTPTGNIKYEEGYLPVDSKKFYVIQECYSTTKDNTYRIAFYYGNEKSSKPTRIFCQMKITDMVDQKRGIKKLLGLPESVNMRLATEKLKHQSTNKVYVDDDFERTILKRFTKFHV